MSNPPGSNDVEHKAYKALPRDMDQEIHKKPRIFIHRPTDQDAEATEEARKRASLLEAAKTIQMEDFAHVHEKPCVRNALLPAIGGGMAVGAGRFVLGGSILAACNWASGSFAGVALVAYQFCQRRRALEKDGIRRAVEVLDKKQALKNMQEQAAGGAASGTAGAAPATFGGLPTIKRPVESTGAPGTTPSGTSAPSGMAANAAEKQGQNFWSTFKFW